LKHLTTNPPLAPEGKCQLHPGSIEVGIEVTEKLSSLLSSLRPQDIFREPFKLKDQIVAI
jgi:hypothetical protein